MKTGNPLLARIAWLILAASILAACARAPEPAPEASPTSDASTPAAAIARAPEATTPIADAPPAAAALSAEPAESSKPTEPNEHNEPSTSASSELRCKTSADCAVKDVGSCCGYQPRCLSKDAQTFPEQVKAQCAKDGRAGICGFQDIASCECVAGQCAASASTGGTLVQ